MPVEIRELVIKATVGKDQTSKSGSNNAGGSLDEQSINEIVEKVLNILKEKSER